MSGSGQVFAFIRENEPVDQDRVESEFGRRGLGEVRRLMSRGLVSYTLDWDLQSEPRTTGSDRTEDADGGSQ